MMISLKTRQATSRPVRGLGQHGKSTRTRRRLINSLITCNRACFVVAVVFLIALGAMHRSYGQTGSLGVKRISDCCFNVTVNNNNPGGLSVYGFGIKPPPGVALLNNASAPPSWSIVYTGNARVDFTSSQPILDGSSLSNFIVCFDSRVSTFTASWIFTDGSTNLISQGTVFLACRDVCDSIAIDSTQMCCPDWMIKNRNSFGLDINRVQLEILSPGFSWNSAPAKPVSWKSIRLNPQTIEYSTQSAPIGIGQDLSGFIPCLQSSAGAQNPVSVSWTTFRDTTVICHDVVKLHCETAPALCDSVSASTGSGNCCYNFALHTRSPGSLVNDFHLIILTPGATIAGVPSGPWAVTSQTSTGVVFSTTSGPLTGIQSIGDFLVCIDAGPTVAGPIKFLWKSSFGGATICTDSISVDCSNTTPGCDALTIRPETSGSIPQDACCYKITLRNTHLPQGMINELALRIITPGTTFASLPTGPWPVQTSTSTDVTYRLASGVLSSGQSAGEFGICVRNAGGLPGPIQLQWQSKLNGSVVCTDTVDVSCSPVSQTVCDSLVMVKVQDCEYNLGLKNIHRPASSITDFHVTVLTPGASLRSTGLPTGWTVKTQTAQNIVFETSTHAIAPNASMSGFRLVFTPEPNGSNTSIRWCSSDGSGVICCDTLVLACATAQRCDSLLLRTLPGDCTFDLGFINRHTPASPITGFRVTVRTSGASISSVVPPAGWIIESNTGPVVVFRDTGAAVPPTATLRGFQTAFHLATGNPNIFFEWCSLQGSTVICCGTKTISCQPQARCDSLISNQKDDCSFDFGFVNTHVPGSAVNDFHLYLPSQTSTFLAAAAPPGWKTDSIGSTMIVFRDTSGVIPVNGTQMGFLVQFRQPTGGLPIPVQWCTSLNGALICCDQTSVSCTPQSGRCDSLMIAPSQDDCTFDLGFANRRQPSTPINELRLAVSTPGAAITQLTLPAGWRIVSKTSTEYRLKDTASVIAPNGEQTGFRIALSPPTSSGSIHIEWCTSIDGRSFCCDSVIVECSPRLLEFDSVRVHADTARPCCFEFSVSNVHRPESEIDGLRVLALDPSVLLYSSTIAEPVGWNHIILGNEVIWSTTAQPIGTNLTRTGFVMCFNNSPTGRSDFELAWRTYNGGYLLSADTLSVVCDNTLDAKPSSPGLQSLILHPGYPNPTGEEARITFEVSRRMHVRLQVFNSLGMEIRNAIDNVYDPGVYNTVIDVRYLAEGVYYYRVSVEGSIRSGTIIVAR